MRKYLVKAKRSRANFIEATKLSNLTHKLSLCETPEEKRQLIAESNPLFYLLGETLTPHNHYTLTTYDNYINHEYLEEVEAQAQGEYYENTI